MNDTQIKQICLGAKHSIVKYLFFFIYLFYFFQKKVSKFNGDIFVFGMVIKDILKKKKFILFLFKRRDLVNWVEINF